MYEEVEKFQKEHNGFPKRLCAPLGLREWECSDGKVYYDSKFAISHELSINSTQKT